MPESDARAFDRRASYTFVLVLFWAGLLMAAGGLLLTGCTGNRTVQSIEGQTASEEAFARATLIDGEGKGTTNVAAPAPLFANKQTPRGVETQAAGINPTVINSKRDGWEVSVVSGADFAARDIEIDPKTGAVKIGEFSRSASAPLDALGRNLAEYRGVWSTWDEGKRQRFADAMKTVEAVSPGLFALIKGLVGMP